MATPGPAGFNRPRGFTLIELMLAILLLAVGVMGVVYAFERGVFATNDTELVGQAVTLAQERLENLRGTAFASIVDEAKAAIPGWTGFSRQVTVTQPPGTNADAKQVVVTVFWTPGPAELSTVLTTVVTNVVNN